MRRSLRLLNLRRLARIRLRMVIAVVAVAAGSSLALSVFIVESSTQYSLNRLDQQVGGKADLRVVGATSAGGITFKTLALASSTPGVKEVIPLVEAITDVRTTHRHNQGVLVIGVTCSAGFLFDGIGCATGPAQGSAAAAQAPGQVFIARSLQRRLSPSSWLETNQGIDSLTGATPLASLNTVNRGDVVVMPLATAQSQFDRLGRIDDIYIVPSPGVSVTQLQHRLTRRLGAQNGVVNATAAPPAVSLAIGEFTPILGVLALVASAIAVVLVYNVISLTLEERRREQAIVAAIGAPPSLLIIGPLLESGVLGAVGGLLGAFGGIVLARPIVSTLSRITLGLVGIPITLHPSSATFVTGVVIGALIGLLAAARPVRRAMRADISAEISGRERRERMSTRSTVGYALVYSLLAIGGAVLSWSGDRNGSLQAWQPAAALIGFVATFVFAIMALGAWAPVVIRLFSRRGRLRGGVVRLGVANLLREPGRTSVMAIAIGAAVGVAFITGSFNRAIDQDIATGFAQSPQAHALFVTTVGAGNGYNTDGQIPAQVLDALNKLTGVAGVDSFLGELTGHTVGQLTLVESDSRPSFNLTVYAGTDHRSAFSRGAVLVGANLARRDSLHPGSRLRIDTPTGTASLLVQGIWNAGDGAGDNVYVPQSLEVRLFGPLQASEAALLVKPGFTAAQVAAEARAAQLGPYLKYQTPAQQLRSADSATSGNLAPFLVLQRALLLVSFISVLSTLLLVGIQRRREFGLLGAVGMTPGELFGMVVTEALVVSVVAVVLGAGLGFLLLASLLDVTPMLVGYHDTYSPDLVSLLVYGPIAVVIAVAAAAWPGRQAARTPILEALNYE
jgi:putative ABC transport system permease protein